MGRNLKHLLLPDRWFRMVVQVLLQRVRFIYTCDPTSMQVTTGTVGNVLYGAE